MNGKNIVIHSSYNNNYDCVSVCELDSSILSSIGL